MSKYFVGIEGGASFSKVVLLNQKGNIISALDNEPSSNIWLIGEDEWSDRINGMVKKVLEKASLDNTLKLDCLGLCLSGCEDENANVRFAKHLETKYPSLTEHCVVESDVIGSIMTGSPDGGIVLIAGTGSNSLLFHPNGLKIRCGGWGHLIGDYGSAYWISQLFLRYIIESDECFNVLPWDLTKAKSIVFEHFEVGNTLGLLKPLYETFNKTFFAQLCAKIAQLAIEDNDPLSRKVFDEAGEMLAKHICALLLKTNDEHISIICVGSVFKSWKLLEKSFLQTLDRQNFETKSISIRYLTQTSAVGAAYFAAKKFDHQVKIEFSENYKLLCTYTKL